MKEKNSTSFLYGDVVFFSYVQNEIEKANTEVYVWDLDKTYLDTSIDSLTGLLRAAIERAFRKKNIPGTDILLQRLGIDLQEKTGNQTFPIYFITASPPQMEERIREKFTFDGINPLGCFYKDNLKNLRPGRFSRLTKQVGYKVQALMQLRMRLSENVRQICFGDDSESDPVIYNLYSDICSRRLSSTDIRSILSKFSVSREQVNVILDLQSKVPSMDPVEKIYINLASDTDPEYYLKFGRRTLPTFNSFQMSLDMFQDGRLSLESVVQVAQNMIENYNFNSDELSVSLDELIRRGVLSQNAFDKLKPALVEKNLISTSYLPSINLSQIKESRDGRVYSLESTHESWLIERIDYHRDDR